MKSIQVVQSAVEALRKVAAKGKTKKSHLENIDNISSAIVLLNSPSPSKVALTKLVSVFRTPLVPLYSSYTETTLRLANAVLQLILNDGVLPCVQDNSILDYDKNRQFAWEEIGNSLLSGVIDFLDEKESNEAKTAIAKTLYSPICDFFFHKNLGANIGASFRSTAYLLLSETAAGHAANQTLLRNEKFLGSHNLGRIISQTKDFSALENLLNLFARLLPFYTASKERHNDYIRDVFSSEYLGLECSKMCLDLLDGVGVDDWDETCTKLIDIVAQSDISFPQPFDVDEIIVCGNTYLQPEFSDKFIIDKTAFFINVKLKDGMYESMQITFKNIQTINFGTSNGTKISVNMKLKSSPRMGDQNLTADSSSLELLVEILDDDIERFKSALNHRKLTDRFDSNKSSRNSKVSVTDSALLDYEIGVPDEVIQAPYSSQKAQEVENFYASDHIMDLGSNNQKTVGNVNTDKGENKDDLMVRKNVNSQAIDDVKPEEATALFDSELSEISDISSVRSPVTKVKKVEKKCIASEVDKATSIEKPKPQKRGRPRKIDPKASTKPEGLKVTKDGEPRKRGRPQKKVVNTTKESTVESNVESIVKVKPKKENNLASDKENITVPPPLSAASDTITAAARRSTVILDSEDEIMIENRLVETALNSKNTSVNQNSKTTMALNRKCLSSPISLSTPPHPSRISRIAKMKAKKTTKNTNSTNKKSQKRTNEEMTSDIEEKSPRKKPRSDTEKNGNADVFGATVTPLPKLSRKTKENIELTKFDSSVNWDQIPSEISVNSPLQEKRKPVSLLFNKKENRNKVKEETKKPMSLDVLKKDTDTQTRSRIPLCSITPAPNMAKSIEESPTNSLLNMKRKAKRFHGIHSAQKATEKICKSRDDDILPSIEDVVKKATKPTRESNTKDTDLTKCVVDLTEDDELGMTTLDNKHIVASTPEHRQKVKKEKRIPKLEISSDPLIQKANPPQPPKLASIVAPSLPSDNVFLEKATARVVPRIFEDDDDEDDDDDDGMNFTYDDIKEALKSLRGKRGQAQEKTTPPQSPEVQSTKKVTEFQESPPKPEQAERITGLDFRPRVKFDDNLRYKSASVESFAEREENKSDYIRNTIERKSRLSGGKAERQKLETIGLHSRKKTEDQVKKEPGMEEIVKVLDSIQDVIASNIDNKSRAVRSDVRIARNKLLHEAITDLEVMREECTENLNNLFALETEYASIQRKMINGFELVSDVNSDICKFLKQTISAHDQGSITKIMPQSLFDTAIPDIFLKYTR